MSVEVEYQGITYTGLPDGTTVDDLLESQEFLDRHQENMLKQTARLAAPSPREQMLLKREEDKSGVGMALLQGLSNDQGYQTMHMHSLRPRS